MPRGRPKGSTNKPRNNLVSSIAEIGREYAIKEISENGIIWVSPALPPFLTKEEADKELESILKYRKVSSVKIVNQKERLAARNGSAIFQSVSEMEIIDDAETE